MPDAELRPHPRQPLYSLSRFVFGLGRVMWKLRVVGRENVPRKGPLLIAPNHESFLDPFYLMPMIPRPLCRFLVNEPWFYKSNRWNRFFRGEGCLATKRGQPELTVARVEQALRHGDCVGVFPEGRISHDGRMNRARLGIGWMAAVSGAPVVPCGLRGTFESLPRDKALPRPANIECHFGEPRTFANEPVRNPDPQHVWEFVSKLATDVAELAGQLERIDEVRPLQPPTDLRAKLAKAFEAVESGADQW